MKIIPNGNILLFGGKNYAHQGQSWRTFASLTEIDTSGNLISQWISEESDSLNWSYSGVLADDGGYVFTTGTHIYINQASRLNDPIIKKLDNNYNELWEQPLFGRDSLPSSLHGHTKVINLRNENTYVLSSRTHKPMPEAEDGNFSDRFGTVIKVDDEGNFIWRRNYQYFTPEETIYEMHYFQDIHETSDGGFIACGEATALDSSTEERPSRSWLVKMDEYGCIVEGCQELEPNTTEELELNAQTVSYTHLTLPTICSV